MKRTLLATLVVLAALTASAQPTMTSALQKYLEKSMPSCPGGKIEISQVGDPAPKGFFSYRVKQTSTDTACGRSTGAFVSPVSGQVLVSDAFSIPVDARPLELRIGALAEQVLQTPVQVRFEQTDLPDDVWGVDIVKQTQYGPFSFHAFVDSSRRYLLVGRRGFLNIDPGVSLLQSLRVDTAAKRGNPASKIQIVELSDFECPSCRRAHLAFEPLIQKNLSKISYSRLDLPLFESHQWSLKAALGARAVQRVAPDKYWAYVDYIFQNQEQIKKENVDQFVKNFAEDHDLDWKKVDAIYRSTKERSDLLAQVTRAFDAGVNATPTFIVNGQFVYFGVDGAYLKKLLETKLGTAKPSTAKAKSKSKK